MSVMSEFDQDLQKIREIMEAGQSAEEQIERRVDFILRELDEFCAMAANSETIDLIEREKIGLGQIITRSQLIASFLMARTAGKLRIVKNG